MTEDEMVGCHHWLNGHEFEQAPGDGDGQGSLACCSTWGRKELETAEWLDNNKNENGFLCVCLFFMYHFYENCHKPTMLYTIILYSIVPYSQFCVLGTSANFVGLTNKLDLWMCSWSATCSYVRELLCSTPKTNNIQLHWQR